MLTSNSLFAHGTELPVCWSWADDALASMYGKFRRQGVGTQPNEIGATQGCSRPGKNFQ
jgi:hypothetical protein